MTTIVVLLPKVVVLILKSAEKVKNRFPTLTRSKLFYLIKLLMFYLFTKQHKTNLCISSC